jgi:hypothetical protein
MIRRNSRAALTEVLRGAMELCVALAEKSKAHLGKVHRESTRPCAHAVRGPRIRQLYHIIRELESSNRQLCYIDRDFTAAVGNFATSVGNLSRDGFKGGRAGASPPLSIVSYISSDVLAVCLTPDLTNLATPDNRSKGPNVQFNQMLRNPEQPTSSNKK